VEDGAKVVPSGQGVGRRGNRPGNVKERERSPGDEKKKTNRPQCEEEKRVKTANKAVWLINSEDSPGPSGRKRREKCRQD
jgi:hypothetical protein